MIFANKAQLNEYPFLEEAVKRCFAYAEENDLLAYEKGSHEIDGEELFVNIVEYDTTSADKRFWEAHKQYLDLHLMLNGEEQIDMCNIHDMKLGEFVPKDDFLPMEGEKNASVVLRNGDFLICYPSDGHRTAVSPDGLNKGIKKAIFKIRIH